MRSSCSTMSWAPWERVFLLGDVDLCNWDLRGNQSKLAFSSHQVVTKQVVISESSSAWPT